MTEATRPQVEPGHYAAGSYGSKERFVSLWSQIAEVRSSGAARVLEVGVGPGWLRRHLSALGVPVVSMDIDPALAPDLAADVRRLPFRDASFPLVVCFQVLEHLRFEDVPGALRELARVSRGRMVLSLPDVGANLRVLLKVPLLPVLRAMVPLDWLARRTHRFDGQHHWEINKRGWPRARFERELRAAGLRVIRTYRNFENPYHRFYVLESAPGSRPAHGGG